MTANKRKRGALAVYEKLREDIQWLKVEPGTALDEVSLAEAHKVSRTPVREALLLLEKEGFVKFLGNRTSIVAPLSLENQAAFLDTFILLSRALIRATPKLDAANYKDLKDLVHEYGQGLLNDDVAMAFKAQLNIYKHLAELTNNRFLSKYFLEAQDASVRMKLLFFFPALEEKDKKDAIDCLKILVNKINQQDYDGADTAVRDSIILESKIIQNGLNPKYGHLMRLS